MTSLAFQTESTGMRLPKRGSSRLRLPGTDIERSSRLGAELVALRVCIAVSGGRLFDTQNKVA